MALTLYLLRHADTLDKERGQSDVERNLSLKGHQEAEEVGHFLREKKIDFDQLVVSHANRAQQTAEIVSQIVALTPSKIQTNHQIYHSTVEGILNLINGFSPEHRHVCIIGHNPAISSLADWLSRQSVGYFSPATLVSITFEVNEWKSITRKTGTINFIKSPRIL